MRTAVSERKSNEDLHLETQLARQLADTDRAYGAAAPPIYQTSTHTFDSWDALAAAFDNRADTAFYGRQLNPSVQLTQRALAQMAGAEAARLCRSRTPIIPVDFARLSPQWSVLDLNARDSRL